MILPPQVALGGSLAVDLTLGALEGSFAFTVVLEASSMISGPLWAISEPCPPSLWMPSDPCDPCRVGKKRNCAMADDEVNPLGTPTANYGWTKPVVGADVDAWGDMLSVTLTSMASTASFTVSRPAFPLSRRLLRHLL